MNPVLVVDDDPKYRELVMLTLEEECSVAQVIGFSAAEQVLRHLTVHADEAALVLLDLHMPDMTGLELLDAIRRIEPRVPVAFLSAAAGDEERQACLGAGAIAFVRKPVAYPDLIRALQELVRSAGIGAGG